MVHRVVNYRLDALGHLFRGVEYVLEVAILEPNIAALVGPIALVFLGEKGTRVKLANADSPRFKGNVFSRPPLIFHVIQQALAHGFILTRPGDLMGTSAYSAGFKLRHYR